MPSLPAGRHVVCNCSCHCNTVVVAHLADVNRAPCSTGTCSSSISHRGGVQRLALIPIVLRIRPAIVHCHDVWLHCNKAANTCLGTDAVALLRGAGRGPYTASMGACLKACASCNDTADCNLHGRVHRQICHHHPLLFYMPDEVFEGAVLCTIVDYEVAQRASVVNGGLHSCYDRVNMTSSHVLQHADGRCSGQQNSQTPSISCMSRMQIC